MDIVITIPKKEYENIDKEIEWAKKLSTKEKGASTKNWVMSRLPSKITDGDRCYFVRDGKITHYREIKGLEKHLGGFTCDVTGIGVGPIWNFRYYPLIWTNPCP